MKLVIANINKKGFLQKLIILFLCFVNDLKFEVAQLQIYLLDFST
jgi:hypothetical protein